MKSIDKSACHDITNRHRRVEAASAKYEVKYQLNEPVTGLVITDGLGACQKVNICGNTVELAGTLVQKAF
jgi:hypothetical protein